MTLQIVMDLKSIIKCIQIYWFKNKNNRGKYAELVANNNLKTEKKLRFYSKNVSVLPYTP